MSTALSDYGLDGFFLQQLSSDELDLPLGRVTEVHRSTLTVVTEEGDVLLSLAPSLQQQPLVDRPTVGDWVLIESDEPQVNRLLDRKSLFKRATAGRGDEIQPIAANIDTLFIVSSCNEEFNESRLERYLLLCNEAKVFPVLVLTKADLTDNPQDYVERAQRMQRDLPVELVNGLDADTCQGLRPWVAKRTTAALVGSSGVGKSTLLNALAGTALAATQDVRQDQKGRHTTTHRALYRLPEGGLIVDVPGMRELRVADSGDALSELFNDIEELALQCRFNDCAHDSEPGCAVKAALEDGSLDERRLNNYLKLVQENTQATATIAERRASEKSFAKVVDGAKSWKKRHDE